MEVSVKLGSFASSVLMVAVNLAGLTERFAPGTNPKPCSKVELPVVESKLWEKILRKVELPVLCASTNVSELMPGVEPTQKALAKSRSR